MKKANQYLRQSLWIALHIGLGSLIVTQPSFAQNETATIKGATAPFQSDAQPAQKICAENLKTDEDRCVETKANQGSYEIKVEPGDYIVSVLLCNIHKSNGDCEEYDDSYKGYYTDLSECQGLGECPEETLSLPLTVRVGEGETATGIRPDWYNEISSVTKVLPPISRSKSEREQFIKAEQLLASAEKPISYGGSPEEKRVAINNLKEAFSIYQKDKNGKYIEKEGEAASSLCHATKEAEEWNEAIKYCEAQVSIQKEVAKKSPDRKTYGSYQLLADAYKGAKEYEKAIETLQKGSKQYDIEAKASPHGSFIGGNWIELSDGKKEKERQKVIDFTREIASLAFSNKDYDTATKYYQEGLNTLINLEKKYPSDEKIDLDTEFYEDRIGLGYSLLRSNNLVEAEKQLTLGYKGFRESTESHEQVWAGRGDETFDIKLEYSLLYEGLQELKIKQGKYVEALELAEETKAKGTINLLSKMTDYDFNLFDSLDIEQIKQIAKEKNSTIVYYSKLLDDKLAIWVINPNQEVTFREVNIAPESKIKSASVTFSVIIILLLSGWLVRLSGLKSNKLVLLSSLALLALLMSACQGGVGSSSRKTNLSLSELTEGVIAEVNEDSRGATSETNKEMVCESKEQCLVELYQLLIDPIEDLLPENPDEQVVIVPDEDLFFVPFAALKESRRKYLIDKHTISTVPSIQVLNMLSKKGNNNNLSFTNSLVVGNPTMPDVTIADSLEGTQQKLTALPGTELEVNQISRILDVTPLLGKEATESAVVEHISQANIIHFATHGLLNAKVESEECKNVDFLNNFNPVTLETYSHDFIFKCQRQRKGIDVLTFAASDENDGLLDETELYELDINANLVILSACETGLGDVSSDGVIGLLRPFIAKGVPTTIATLWQINDDPSAELMVEFYQNLQSGKNKAQALRQAMLATKEKYPEPYNWAAFTLVGEAI